MLPRGTVGDSIIGDLSEQYVQRAGMDHIAADDWYRQEARSVAFHSIRDKLLGKWIGEPRYWRGGSGGGSRGKGDPMFERFVKGWAYTMRSLLRTPRYTFVAVLTLALGIGANTAIFSVVNGVLLQPLDYPESGQLVNVFGTAPAVGYNRMSTSAHYYSIYRSESSAFSGMGMYHRIPGSLTGSGDPEDVRAVAATHTLFPTLGVNASLGRTFSAEEDLPGAPRVVLISHGLWQRRFGSDRDALETTLNVNGEVHQVVGVMPRGFDYPGGIDVWVPVRLDLERAPWNFTYPTIGRLAAGVSATQAQAQLAPIMERIVETYYPEGSDWRRLIVDGQYAPVVRSMKEDMVGSLERPLWILLGTVGFVLLIACTNVANLVLIRGEIRCRESAVRAALGATRDVLLRQSLTESSLLAFAGAAFGLFAAWLGVPALLSHAPPQLPRLDEVGVDAHVLLFTLGATVLSVLLFGLAPLLRVSPSALFAALKQGGNASTSGPRRERSRAVLVVAQTALALVLMVGSGLLVRSFWEVYGTDLGFGYDKILTFKISLPESRYPTPTEKTAFHEDVLDQLRALPGVEAAALTSVMPVADGMPATTFEVMGSRIAEEEPRPLLDHKYVSSGYVETMGIRLVAGQTFSPADNHGGAGQVLVNQLFVDRFWPDDNPVGKQVRFGQQPDRWYSVAGVVGATRENGARQDPRPLIYLPLMGIDGDDGWSVSTATFIVRSENPSAVAQSIPSAVWDVDFNIPIAGIRAGADIVAESIVQLTFTMVTLGIAACLAVVLGTIGLYGVLSYSVAQRRQEIAVHMALGARQREVVQKVVGDGAKIVTLGIVVGLACARALTRLLGGILFGVEALDPLTYGGVATALLLVAVAAAYLPARRAAAVDPVEAMRVE